MENATKYEKALETRIRREQMGKGYLEVHTKYVHGEKVMEAFTLTSLAECMDLPMSTMEGRYARGKLHYWKVDIHTGTGRPTRGFQFAQLADVVQIIQTPGACVRFSPNGDTITKEAKPQTGVPLVPTYYLNKPHFTIQALADHFGFSATTIRNKLQKAGLMKRLVNLGSSLHGGRPSRALPESALGDAKLAIVDNVVFQSELDRVLIGASTRVAAKDYMAAQIPNHTPPAGLRAYDHETMSPVVPLNRVNSRGSNLDIDKMADDLVAELDAIIAAGLKKPQPSPGYNPPLAGDRVPTETVATIPNAEEEDEHLVRRRMYQMQVDALSEQPEEPTKQELADTADMLALDKAATERFVAEVKAARAQRGAA